VMHNSYRTIESYKLDMAMGPVGFLVNVSQSLPEAMAKALPRAVEMEQEIARIDVSDNGVEIETKGGKVWRAAQVICTVPLPVLAKMTLNAPLSDVQKRAFKEHPYTHALQLQFHAKRLIWEEDGFAASMWSDGPIERIFARPGEDGQPDGV